MIAGRISNRLEARVEITIVSETGEREIVSAAIDTGFTGFLTLRATLIDQLSLLFLSTIEATLADGTRHEMDVYEGIVEWNGAETEIPIVATAGGSLLGMAMLRGFRLQMDVVPNGTIAIVPVPTN